MTYKKSPKSKKSNCTDYLIYSKRNCLTRKNCIDKCINRLHFERHSSITIHSVINKNEFNISSLVQTNFNESNDPTIVEQCSREFTNSDCTSIRYFESTTTEYGYNKWQLFINLNFVKYVQKETTETLTGLILNILNLESILFGSNATNLLLTLIHTMKKLFNLNLFKLNAKASRVIVYLFCLVGFCFHNYHIFDEIINYELVDNGYFKPAIDNKLPNIIYCFSYPQNRVDENHRISISYLDRMTDYLNYENVFDRIGFYNKTVWKTFRPTNGSVSMDNEISIGHFYFNKRKCLEINLNVLFNEDDFLFASNKFVLAIHFRRELYKQFEFVLFSYRETESRRLCETYKYKIGHSKTNSTKLYKYRLNFETIEIERNDRFELIKNPLNLFYKTININDVTNYLNKMKESFESNYNLTTNKILLSNFETQNLKREIDNELFKQFELQGKLFLVSIFC